MSTFQGVQVEIPFTSRRDFVVARVDQECGRRYAYYYLSGDPVAHWSLSWSALSDAELATLLAWLDTVKGGWDTFSFTDYDTGTTYSTCVLEGAEFPITHTGPNEHGLTLYIAEVK